MIRNLFISVATLILMADIVLAQPNLTGNQFTVALAPNSPFKDVSLNNTTLQIKVYLDGNPNGNYTVVTDSNGNFAIPTKFSNRATVHIVGVGDLFQNNIRCNGNSTQGQSNIVIVCMKV